MIFDATECRKLDFIAPCYSGLLRSHRSLSSGATSTADVLEISNSMFPRDYIPPELIESYATESATILNDDNPINYCHYFDCVDIERRTLVARVSREGLSCVQLALLDRVTEEGISHIKIYGRMRILRIQLATTKSGISLLCVLWNQIKIYSISVVNGRIKIRTERSLLLKSSRPMAVCWVPESSSVAVVEISGRITHWDYLSNSNISMQINHEHFSAGNMLVHVSTCKGRRESEFVVCALDLVIAVDFARSSWRILRKMAERCIMGVCISTQKLIFVLSQAIQSPGRYFVNILDYRSPTDTLSETCVDLKCTGKYSLGLLDISDSILAAYLYSSSDSDIGFLPFTVSMRNTIPKVRSCGRLSIVAAVPILRNTRSCPRLRLGSFGIGGVTFLPIEGDHSTHRFEILAVDQTMDLYTTTLNLCDESKIEYNSHQSTLGVTKADISKVVRGLQSTSDILQWLNTFRVRSDYKKRLQYSERLQESIEFSLSHNFLTFPASLSGSERLANELRIVFGKMLSRILRDEFTEFAVCGLHTILEAINSHPTLLSLCNLSVLNMLRETAHEIGLNVACFDDSLPFMQKLRFPWSGVGSALNECQSSDDFAGQLERLLNTQFNLRLPQPDSGKAHKLACLNMLLMAFGTKTMHISRSANVNITEIQSRRSRQAAPVEGLSDDLAGDELDGELATLPSDAVASHEHDNDSHVDDMTVPKEELDAAKQPGIESTPNTPSMADESPSNDLADLLREMCQDSVHESTFFLKIIENMPVESLRITGKNWKSAVNLSRSWSESRVTLPLTQHHGTERSTQNMSQEVTVNLNQPLPQVRQSTGTFVAKAARRKTGF